MDLSKFAQEYCIQNGLPLFNDPLESSKLSSEFMDLPLTTIGQAQFPELIGMPSIQNKDIHSASAFIVEADQLMNYADTLKKEMENGCNFSSAIIKTVLLLLILGPAQRRQNETAKLLWCFTDRQLYTFRQDE